MLAMAVFFGHLPPTLHTQSVSSSGIDHLFAKRSIGSFGIVKALLISLAIPWFSIVAAVAEARDRPNILLIVADDLGYSDVGAFGGEIQTPNLDALASEGIMLTRFHTAPNCSPSRGAMLSGVDYHRAGLGGNIEIAADNQKGLAAYQGFLRDDVIAFPELLRDAGYHTSMAGKWHMGKDPRNLPGGRGFEQSFALLNGGASHWADQLALIPGSKTIYTENDEVVRELPTDFYSSTYYADKIIEYIDSGLDANKPFFAYLAFTAPHNPLHAPDDSIAKYRGAYDKGWDVLANARFQRQQELGLIANSASPAKRPEWILSWNKLSQNQQLQRQRDMEIYAGMIDYMDESIGRVLQHLKNKGEYDNTLVVFISDNGPSKTSIADYVALGGKAADFVRSFDNSLENKGRPGSSTDIGPGWAYASATPLRLFKGYVTQGGIQVPAIIKTPISLGRPPKAIVIPIHVLDLAPTFLELAGSIYPDSYRGVTVPPLQGESLLPLLLGSKSSLSGRGLGWEAYGMDAWIEGDWKLVRLPKPYGNDRWQLYDLNQDPGEIDDLAALRPQFTASLVAKWHDYAITNEVVHPDSPVAYGKTPKPGRY